MEIALMILLVCPNAYLPSGLCHSFLSLASALFWPVPVTRSASPSWIAFASLFDPDHHWRFTLRRWHRRNEPYDEGKRANNISRAIEAAGDVDVLLPG